MRHLVLLGHFTNRNDKFPNLTYISTIEFPALFIYLETENAAFLRTGNYTSPPPSGFFPGTWYLGFLFLDLTKSHNSPIKASRAVFWSMSCYKELKLIIKLFTGRTRCGKIFMEIFWSMLHCFLPFSPVSLTELSSFWYGLKDLFTLHKLDWPLKLMTSQAVEGTWSARTVTSHEDVLRGSSRVPGARTRDEPRGTSVWEATHTGG